MKKKTNCGDCKYQMSGFDGGFFGLPVTCECRFFGETENRKSCSRFEKRMSREDLFERIRLLEKENEKLKEQHNQLQEKLRDANDEVGYWKSVLERYRNSAKLDLDECTIIQGNNKYVGKIKTFVEYENEISIDLCDLKEVDGVERSD